MGKSNFMLKIGKILALILIFNCFTFCFNACTIDSITIDYDSSAISAAQQIVKDTLKNPSSAIFNEARVELKDDYRRYIVYVDVSAQNGFGGYTRDKYYVGLRLAEDGETYWYFPNLPYVTADYLTAENAKNMFFDDWGKEIE